MAVSIERIRKMGAFVEKAFPAKKKYKSSELRGLFPDIGKEIRKEGKTSVDLVRELRKA